MAVFSGCQKWYVLQSKPQKENIVSAQLCREGNCFQTFFPKIRNHLGVRPLFPSYLFVYGDLENLENYQMLKFTRGVLRIIGSREGKPIPVPDEAISLIQGRMGPDGLIDQSTIFRMGQVVRVRRGPMKDLIGILERPVSEAGRIQVLFKMFKYPIRAVLKFEDLATAAA